MRTDIATQAKYDAIINEERPKVLARGWKEEAVVNVFDENGNKEDIKRVYRNELRPGEIVSIFDRARKMNSSTPLSYEEFYWFSRIGLAGGFDDDEVVWD